VTDFAIKIRPMRAEDFWLLERQAVDPDAGGRFNWSGYKDLAHARHQFEHNGLIGADEGLLVVVSDGDVVGKVVWGKNTYGVPQWWCWSIGIGLLPEFRNKGIGTKAQFLLIRYLFETTAVERVEAYADVDNGPEQRVLEKLGFRREGVIRSAQFREGRWCDVALYGLLRDEFKPSAAPFEDGTADAAGSSART
jgi:RimJ/RimL family protein N-acetyltransferase